MAKKNQKEELASRLLGRSWESLSEREKRVIEHLGERQHISHDTNQEFDTKLTFGQRLADKVAAFGGSWTFILIFAAVLLSWVLLNSLILARRGNAFDAYPYILDII